MLMTDKMKAWVLTTNGPTASVFEQRELPVPTPAEDEVLIKVWQFGLNFADVMAMLGLYRDCPPLPAVIGYDIGGVVEAVGASVTTWKVGDTVVGMTRFGGYAEYAVTKAQALTKLPEGLAMEDGVAMITQGVTAEYMASYQQPVRAGEKVLVHAAAGGVGGLLVQMAVNAGASVAGTAGSKEKLDKISRLGTSLPINYRSGDFVSQIESSEEFGKLDVIFDPVGGASVKQGIKLLRPGGRMVVFGGSSFTNAKGFFSKLRNFLRFGFYHPMILLGKSISILGVNMLRIGDHRPEVLAECLQSVVDKAGRKELVADVFKVYPAAEFPDAIMALAERKTTGKVVVSWDS